MGSLSMTFGMMQLSEWCHQYPLADESSVSLADESSVLLIFRLEAEHLLETGAPVELQLFNAY